jgi:hypothetical protein
MVIVRTWLAVLIAVCVAPVMSAAPVPLPSVAERNLPAQFPVTVPLFTVNSSVPLYERTSIQPDVAAAVFAALTAGSTDTAVALASCPIISSTP